MKKLSSEEADAMILLGRGKESPLSTQLKNLAVGEGLFLPAGEWRRPGAPYRIANYVAKRNGRRFQQGRMPDGSGWVFKRME